MKEQTNPLYIIYTASDNEKRAVLMVTVQIISDQTLNLFIR